MTIETSQIGKCVRLAAWLAVLYLPLHSNLATAAAPTNLLTRPGFEAAEAALKAVWRPLEPGGYEVDRQEKHTGNQSIKLAIARKGVTKGASYVLRSDQVKAPSSILVSAWSKGEGVTGTKDDAYAIYIDVNYADGTNLHQVTARLPEAQLGTMRPLEVEIRPGVVLGHKHIPVQCVGSYVPGGRYFLLMTVAVISILLIVLINLFLWVFSR